MTRATSPDAVVDLVLRDAEIFDGTRLTGRGDVAVRNGRIAEIGPALAVSGREERSLSGALLTPGWVDLHTHIDAGRTFWGIDPTGLAWATGVTTWVDAGSAGVFGIDALSAATAALPVRAPLLINVSAIGLVGTGGEVSQQQHLRIDETVTAVLRARERVRGVKVRLSEYTVGELGSAPLRAALEVAEQTGLPLMAHIGEGVNVTETFDALRPGDIVTHAFTPGLHDAIGEADALDSIERAYARGIVFDLGHGSGSFSYRVADALLERGIHPHSYSSDLHLHSRHGIAHSLPEVLSSVLALGVELEAALRGVTSGPARALGLPSGELVPGAAADLAVFTREELPLARADATGIVRTSPFRLRNLATYVAGAELPAHYSDEPPAWLPIDEAQRERVQRRAQQVRRVLLGDSDEPSRPDTTDDSPAADRTADHYEHRNGDPSL